ncbi:DUF4209 domain-containing protein [Pseudomonas aeruginosa]|uniref:DUF4209 domain-containing protein n=1 Tax=Pseudomonas aeruginosa TaxID=287 RepID=UPI0003BB0769|nr:DUF4209 domain-containing protein [Pseudomonas aeruginosa]ERZ30886.1 hypothetical protein Q003_02642 [Pseudomonas aeruginosa CF27]MBV5885568.1 DUF4209 domain-containing protein [Pseudomonas aeruginosa]MDI4122799.1 DUF4209 domain-containing protein [Pseudomonas aeruginosa]RPO66382.1 DUF4209 domain-containing protein [Pseudomonas aeruginosa]RQI80625.1 DUF4209 domain-containing protein [Pseudomonas aeruginosa]
MENQRYPVDLIVSAQDFTSCGWKEVLEQTAREGYSAMWQAFSAAARTAMEEGREEHGKVLWLLADASSMMLMPASQNEPFKPIAVFHDRRSVIPDDLTDSDIAFFSEIVDSIDDIWLKARLADLCWLKRKPKVAAHALAAIDAYRTIPLDTETWVRGGRECWGRAISLARMLKAGAGDRVQQMEAAILAVLNAAGHQDGFLGLWLADLLKTNGMARARRTDIAKRLESLAWDFDSTGDVHRAREYFSGASDWYRLSADVSKAAEMTVAVAEGWVKEAIAQTSLSTPSHMVAASFYENAIQTYRAVPRSERAAFRVDERIAELRTHLNDSGEKALGEMGVISTPGVDISELVENARKAVSGKSPIDALKAFANLHRGARVDALRKGAIDRMQQFPLQSLFAATVMSRDGRVIAKRPAMSFGSEATDSDEVAIRAGMIQDYGILVHIVVQGDIWPALETMLLEHRLREADFIDLARNSPIVPKGREGLFGKALFCGYERDFVSALHLLIPQIEHMVRVHLKQAGAKTTNLDQDGIENENGMSTLMDLPEAETVFGKDLTFELKTLFCDAFGPNLRNELAHGLLDEDSCHSPYAIYAWWLGMRLVFNTWWNAAHTTDAETGV